MYQAAPLNIVGCADSSPVPLGFDQSICEVLLPTFFHAVCCPFRGLVGCNLPMYPEKATLWTATTDTGRASLMSGSVTGFGITNSKSKASTLLFISRLGGIFRAHHLFVKTGILISTSERLMQWLRKTFVDCKVLEE